MSQGSRVLRGTELSLCGIISAVSWPQGPRPGSPFELCFGRPTRTAPAVTTAMRQRAEAQLGGSRPTLVSEAEHLRTTSGKRTPGGGNRESVPSSCFTWARAWQLHEITRSPRLFTV
jgi:hypothetical protein